MTEDIDIDRFMEAMDHSLSQYATTDEWADATVEKILKLEEKNLQPVK